jgi:integrase
MLNEKTGQTLKGKIDRKLIDSAVKKQRLTGSRVVLADTECFGLRLVVNSKSASWTYAYRCRGFVDGGKRHPQKTMKLGDLASLNAIEARFAAENVKAQVREGNDPASEARAQKRVLALIAARQKSLEQWLVEYGLSFGTNPTNHQQSELAHVRRAIHELKIFEASPDDIVTADFRRLIQMHLGRPSTARHRFGAFSRFFDFLLDNDVILKNPADGVSKSKRPKPSNPRERFYTEEELKCLWHPSGPIHDKYLRFLRFMICVPFREGEASRLQVKQVDLVRKEIRLHWEDTKNKEAFTMPLHDLVQSVIGPELGLPDALVFPLSNIIGKEMTAWSYFNNAVRRASGVSDFNFHDLRRTFMTLISEKTNFIESHLDGLLNHKQSETRSGVMRSYQQAKHLNQRRQVMQFWNELLIDIVN